MKNCCEEDLKNAIVKGNSAKALACTLFLRRDFKPEEILELSVNALYNNKNLVFFREFVKNERFHLTPQNKEIVRLRVLSDNNPSIIANYYSIFENKQLSQDDLLVLTSQKSKKEARQKLAQYQKINQSENNSDNQNNNLAYLLGDNLITP